MQSSGGPRHSLNGARTRKNIRFVYHTGAVQPLPHLERLTESEMLELIQQRSADLRQGLEENARLTRRHDPERRAKAPHPSGG